MQRIIRVIDETGATESEIRVTDTSVGFNWEGSGLVPGDAAWVTETIYKALMKKVIPEPKVTDASSSA